MVEVLNKAMEIIKLEMMKTLQIHSSWKEISNLHLGLETNIDIYSGYNQTFHAEIAECKQMIQIKNWWHKVC